jgi:hypothetical protein
VVFGESSFSDRIAEVISFRKSAPEEVKVLVEFADKVTRGRLKYVEGLCSGTA